MITHRNQSPVNPSRVVVLGSSGFVGTHLVHHLAELSIPTITVGSAQIDLCDTGSVEALRNTIQEDDAVVFVSALTPDRGRDIGTLMQNLAMGEHLCSFLEGSPCAQVVYVSSDAVYSDGDSLVDETSHCDPAGFHGVMHLTREHMLRYALRELKTPLLLARPSLLYGPGDTHNGYGPNRFLRTAQQDRKISLFGKGEDKRDHVYIKDFARILGLCLMHRSEGRLNVATGASVSFREVAELVEELCRESGREVEIEYASGGAAVSHRHFDISASLKSFPNFRYTALKEGLLETLDPPVAVS